MHLAFAEVEVDVVVRHDAREALGDVAHLEHRAAASVIAAGFYGSTSPRASTADRGPDEDERAGRRPALSGRSRAIERAAT